MLITCYEHKDYANLKNRFFPDYSLHPLHSTLSNEYYKEYFFEENNVFFDKSFLIHNKDLCFCFVGISIRKIEDDNYILDYFGNPAFIYERFPSGVNVKTIESLLKSYFVDLFNKYAITTVSFINTSPKLTFPALFFLKKNFSHKLLLRHKINIDIPLDKIKKNFRKGHISAIKWLEKNIALKILDSTNVSDNDISNFRNLHIKTAKRETRSRHSWNIQQKMIEQNEAFAVFGYKNNKLISASLFQHSKSKCFYSVGVSDRSEFTKPVSHLLIYHAIKKAKELGCKEFDMGEQIFDSQYKAKESNISSFKRGFGGDTFCEMLIG